MADATVFIIVQDDAARASFVFLLETLDCTVQDFGTAEAFLAEYRTGNAGCLLLSQDMRHGTGLASLQMLRIQGTNLSAVITAEAPSTTLRRRAAQLGAVVVASSCPATLIATIEQALAAGPRGLR